MFFDFLSQIARDFLNPSNRLYIPTLLFTLLFTFVIIKLLNKDVWKEIKSGLFAKKIWGNESVIMDIKLYIFNNSLEILIYAFLSYLVISAHDLSVIILSFLNSFLGEITPLSQSSTLQKVFYTLFSFVVLDFFRFFQHYLMHKVPLLWRYHRIHHSAEVLTPLTVTRVHPFEMFLSQMRTAFAIGLSTSIFVYLFQVPVTGFEILGVNFLGFLFNALGANLRHSHVWLSFGVFEHIFISPSQHQIHHSHTPEHHDKNFGVALSCWDKLFKTFLFSKNVDRSKIEYGCNEINSKSFWQLIKP